MYIYIYIYIRYKQIPMFHHSVHPRARAQFLSCAPRPCLLCFFHCSVFFHISTWPPDRGSEAPRMSSLRFCPRGCSNLAEAG